MVKGNAGRTVACPLLDEAGIPWLVSGSAPRLWENLIQEVGPGPVQGVLALGFELLALPPYALDSGLGTHHIAIPSEPGLIGLALPAQGVRVELKGAKLSLVLTNGQDVLFGF